MRKKMKWWLVNIFFIFLFKIGFNQDLVGLELLNVSEISTYDKVELGVELPLDIEQKIEKYVRNRFPISFKWSEPGFINPFDPNQLDVQLDFWQPNDGGRSEHYKRFGFYFDAFSTSRGNVIPIKTSHNIKVRFTPRKEGEWNCKAVVIIRGDTLTSSTFSFKCSESKSSTKGFLEISDNKKYFEVKDSVFFPVGQNIPWPGEIWYNGTSTLPHRDYESYHRLIASFKEGGGNYYRMLITPWTYDIEFENLGNYSNRMSNAWELDRLINFLEEKDLKIHFNMLLHGVLENPSVYTITNWDWPAYASSVYGDKSCVSKEDKGFCYGRELDLKHPIEFFTDQDAKRFYKNKLRYMIARWGYSTSIGVFELLSEINNLGQQANLKNTGNGCPNIGTVTIPYNDSSSSVPKIVLAWQNEMAKYIKEELGHKNHPLAVSYTNRPDIKNGDLSYYSPFIDIATYNAYSYDRNQNKLAYISDELSRLRKDKLMISNSSLKNDDSRRSIVLEKPFMLSEIGSGLSICANSTTWKQSVYLSPFIGLAGVAMPWNNYNNNRDLWHNFKNISSFLNQIPLNKNQWSTAYYKSKSNKAEVYSLQDTKTKMLVGAVNNRTYNYYTKRDSCLSCYCSKDKVSLTLRELETITNNKENKLKVNKLGSFNEYRVSWYNPLNGTYIIDNSVIKTNLFGQVKLNYPKLDKSILPFVYFKIEKL